MAAPLLERRGGVIPTASTSGPTEAAAVIAHRLLETAGSATQPHWSGPDIVGDDSDWRIDVGPLPDGLYGGTAGIALFLAATSAPSARRVAGAAAERLLTAAPALLAADELDLASGAAGIAYAIAWTGQLVQRNDLVADARRLALDVATRLDRMSAHDLLSGVAGAALAVLAISADVPAVVASCEAAAHRLAASAQPEAWGRSWPDDPAARTVRRHQEADRPGLLGLGHGGAGIAVALAEVAALTGDRDLKAAAQAAVDYENSWSDPRQPGWPDLRRAPGVLASETESTESVDLVERPGSVEHLACPAFWCHGAVGIGIGRVRLHQLDPAPAILADVGISVEAARQRVMAARAALREGRPTDCSLCHGLAGVVELFLAASDLPGGAAHLRAARRVGDLLLEQHVARGSWPSGLPDGQETPGLFLGTAGIGLTLLRVDDRTNSPSVALPQALPEVTRWKMPPG